MSSIDVIGGVYSERCAFPHWDQIYGSAGRAAFAISDYLDEVRLHTVIAPELVRNVTALASAHGVSLKAHHGKQVIGFDYLHSHSTPNIFPQPNFIEQCPTFHVQTKVAVLFGMLECSPTVNAEYCFYDPQSPLAPKTFKSTGSTAHRLTIIANSREIELLTGLTGESGAKALIEAEDAETVVCKSGVHGAIVYERDGTVGHVPAYKAHKIFSIGSGDVFVAAYSYAKGIENLSSIDSARFASKSVAQYLESSALPIRPIAEVNLDQFDPVVLKGGKVYIAGPFRELGQRILIDEARRIIASLGMIPFSPVHDIGHGPAEVVVKKDLEAIKSCDAMFAILNGSSPGTVFEVGFAAALGKPIYCLAQNLTENNLKLPIGAGAIVESDFISALHKLAWRP